jgi:hypothetical protein
MWGLDAGACALISKSACDWRVALMPVDRYETHPTRWPQHSRSGCPGC